MDSEFRYSVVVPAFNPGTDLDTAIESIVSQSVLPSELVVVDDGSERPIRLPVEINGISIVLVRQENRGYGGALNTGIRHASEAMVAFLDHDDEWFENKTELQLQEVAKGYKVVCGGTLIVDERKTPPATKLVSNSRVFGACLFSRDVFETVGPLPEGPTTGEPFDWWSRFMDLNEEVGHVSSPVLKRRIHGSNLGLRNPQSSSTFLIQRVREHHQKRQER